MRTQQDPRAAPGTDARGRQSPAATVVRGDGPEQGVCMSKTVCVIEPIVLVTLPEGSRGFIMEGDDRKALDPDRFDGDVKELMAQVNVFLVALSDPQRALLRAGLRHAIEGAHGGSVLFSELAVGYDFGEGIGLEIKDRSVTEEGFRGPVQFIFSYFSTAAAATYSPNYR
jgi:hypothetical protein